MLVRRLVVIAVLTLLASSLWAREKLDIKGLMARSDALYYTPSLHGVTDLAVDLVIDQFANNPIAKAATVTYYYAGSTRQRVSVSNVPDQYAEFRNGVMDLVSSVGQYIMPLPTSASFTGMTLRMEKTTRELLGVKETDFYEIIGKPTGTKDTMKEYRVLVDKDGLLHQIEDVTGDNNELIAMVENVHLADGWHIATITTRVSKDGVWKIEHLEYGLVDSYMLPVRYSVQYRDTMNKPVKDMGDLAMSFKDYRINKGVAAAAVPQPEPATTPPASTATPPTSTATPPASTATPPASTATPPASPATPPASTATPSASTATPPASPVTPSTSTATWHSMP